MTCSSPSNLAPAGTASQSSDYFTGGYPASLAIDDILENFSHTDSSDQNPTWTLDLAGNSIVEQVVLHNRNGCCGQRLRDITVLLLDSGSNVVYDSGLLNPANALNSPASITVDLPASTQGVTLEVHRTHDSSSSGDDASVLTLGEVVVNGCTAP